VSHDLCEGGLPWFDDVSCSLIGISDEDASCCEGVGDQRLAATNASCDTHYESRH
jgi:hypothetical protein